MADEFTGSPHEIKEVAEKALGLQRYLLRRAWGVLYATWSVAFFLSIFGNSVALSLGLSAGYSGYDRIVGGILASGAAIAITLWAFKRVRDTAEIRSLVVEGKWKRVLGYQVLVPIWVAIYVFLLLSVFLLGLPGGPLVLSVYVAFWAYLYYALRLSFPGNLPAEGIATLASFGAATAGSILTYLSLRIPDVYGLLWGVTIAIWVVSALYARTLRLPKPREDPAA